MNITVGNQERPHQPTGAAARCDVRHCAGGRRSISVSGRASCRWRGRRRRGALIGFPPENPGANSPSPYRAPLGITLCMQYGVWQRDRCRGMGGNSFQREPARGLGRQPLDLCAPSRLAGKLIVRIHHPIAPQRTRAPTHSRLTSKSKRAPDTAAPRFHSWPRFIALSLKTKGPPEGGPSMKSYANGG